MIDSMTGSSRVGAFALVVLTLGICLGACKKHEAAAGSPTGGAADGTERGACYGNGTCNDGLTCLSDLCVRPPGADCAKVAEKLSYLLLDNYAPQDQRTTFLATTRADCEAMHLTRDEGACLIDAPHRNALGRCPKLVGVGDCAKILAHLGELSGQDEFLVTASDHVIARCKNETPSKTFEVCALAAKAVGDLDRCTW
jgi:hypothetical protein